jgi:hypothetical protein
MKHLVLVAILLISINANSQYDQGHLGIFGTFSFPLGDFGDDDEFDNSGMAGFGLGGGLSYSIPVVNDWLHVAFDASVLYHAFDEEKTGHDPVLANVNNLEGGNYWFFPVLAGIKGTYDLNARFQTYAVGELGFSPILEQTMNGDFQVGSFILTSGERTFENAIAFVFSIGGGVVVADRVVLGVRYLNFGEPDVDYTTEASNSSSSGERSFHISVFQCLVGVEF